MRVAYLHQYFRTPEMGGITRSYEMARRLVARGHEVDMVTADCSPRPNAPRWRTEMIAGVRVHWTPVPYDNSMGGVARIRSFAEFALRARKRAPLLEPDVVFATSTPLTIAIPGIHAAHKTGVPMVFEVRDMWPDVPIAVGALRDPVSKKLARWLEAKAYAEAAHIVALAPGMRDDIIAKGVLPEKVTVIPNGADLDLFDVDEAVVDRLRREHTWLQDYPMVLYAGAVSTANGVDYLVRLAAAVANLDPLVRFVVAGTGRDFDAVAGLARDLGVLDNSLFMLGAIPKTCVAKWLAAATISCGLLTGPRILWKDAVSNKFFDALAAGRPIANNFEGYSSVVARDAGAGIILDAEDVDAAARHLVAHIRDEGWLRQAREAAAGLARDRFNRDTLAADLERVLLDAVAGGA